MSPFRVQASFKLFVGMYHYTDDKPSIKPISGKPKWKVQGLCGKIRLVRKWVKMCAGQNVSGYADYLTLVSPATDKCINLFNPFCFCIKYLLFTI